MSDLLERIKQSRAQAPLLDRIAAARKPVPADPRAIGADGRVSFQVPTEASAAAPEPLLAPKSGPGRVEKLWNQMHTDPGAVLVDAGEAILQTPARLFSKSMEAAAIVGDKLTGGRTSPGPIGDLARGYAQPEPTTPGGELGAAVGTLGTMVGAPALAGAGRVGALSTAFGIGSVEQGVANYHASGGDFNAFLGGLGLGGTGAVIPLDRLNKATGGGLAKALVDVATFGAAGSGQTALNDLMLEKITGKDLPVWRDMIDAGAFGALTGAMATAVAHVAMAQPKATEQTAPGKVEITDKAPEAPTSELKVTVQDDPKTGYVTFKHESGALAQASKPRPWFNPETLENDGSAVSIAQMQAAPTGAVLKGGIAEAQTHTRQGRGTDLMDAIIAYAKENGADKISGYPSEQAQGLAQKFVDQGKLKPVEFGVDGKPIAWKITEVEDGTGQIRTGGDEQGVGKPDLREHEVGGKAPDAEPLAPLERGGEEAGQEGAVDVLAKQPWEMTKAEFESESLFHGTSKSSGANLLKDQSFDIGRFGTGADKNFVKGKVGAFGLGQGAGFYGKGTYLTSRESVARMYAEARKSGTGSVLRTLLSKRPLDASARESFLPELKAWWIEHVAAVRKEKGLDPYKGDLSDAFDAEVASYESGFAKAAMQYASEKGYPGVRFNDSEIVLSDPSVVRLITDADHRSLVERAVSEGKPVPPEVLADYPDLAPPTTKAHPTPAPVGKPDMADAPGKAEAVAPAEGAASVPDAPDNVRVDFKSIDAERAKLGLPESTHGERRAWEKANEEAASRDPRRLLSELERNPRPLTDTDVATILREKNRLRLERNAIEKQIKAEGDSPELQARAQEVADEIFKLGETIGPAKTKSGQGLAALKMAMKEDYSLGEIERTLRVANKNESSAEVAAKAKELHDRLDAYVQQFDEYQAKVETRLREVETKALKREVRRRQREPGKVEEFLTKKADEARARLKSAGIARDVGSVLEDVAIIGAEKVVKGTIEFAEWSKAMIEDLGEKVKPHLEAAFERAKALAQETAGETPRERDLLRQIAALEKQIKTGELKPTGAKQGPETENVQNLRTRRDALADRVKKMRETPAEANSATQREVRALDKRIARLDERIKAGDTSALTKPKQGPKPAEVAEMVEKRAALRKELAVMRREERRATRGDPRLRAAKTRMKNLADKLFERITYEDFAKREKKPPVELDEEGLAIKARLDQAKRDIPIAVRMFERRHWSEGRRQLDNAKQVLGAATDVLTSMDLPPILRQGGWLAWSHPILSSKAFIKSFPAMGGEIAKAKEALKSGEFKEAWKYAMSDEGARKIQAAIESHPNYEKLKAGGVEFTGYGDSLTHQEENVRSRISQNIPVTAQTQRGFVAFMNLQRFIVGSHLLNRAQTGTKAEQAKSVGRYINDATGRGHFTNKKLDAGLELARLGLFAPRLYLSRLNLLTGRAWREATPEVRRLIERDYAVLAATIGAIGGFAALMGNEDAFDWRSADLLKIRVGDTRLDLTPQLAQYGTLLGRMATGETKSDAGVKPADVKDVVASFAENKLTPPLSAAIEMKKSLQGEKGRSGEVETPLSVIGNLITPMSPRQVVQTIKAQGFSTGVAMSLAGMLGAGLNTYQTKKKAGYYR